MNVEELALDKYMQYPSLFILSNGKEGKLHGHKGKWVRNKTLEVWGSSLQNASVFSGRQICE